MIFGEWLQTQYDKILHVTCTFTAMMFLCLGLEVGKAVTIVLTLQVAKTMWNYQLDDDYRLYGDWVANMGGYLLFVAYWLIKYWRIS